MLKSGEPLKETRERISKRTGIKGKLLQQIKFALVSRAPYGKHVNKARNFWGRAEGMFIR